jgi:GST-like protein
MAVWGWALMLPHVMGDKDVWAKFPAVKRLVDEINLRPASDGVERLKRQAAFKKDWDEEAHRNLFPQLQRLEGHQASRTA